MDNTISLSFPRSYSIALPLTIQRNPLCPPSTAGVVAFQFKVIENYTSEKSLFVVVPSVD